MSEEKNYTTFINRPFVAKDGRDVEVLVQRGNALVESVNEKKSRDTVQFKFASDNLKKHGIGGWVNKSNDPKLYDLLKEAYDDETIVFLRIEKQRKPHVDEDSPIKELLKDMESAHANTITIIASARLSEEDDWVESSESVTHPDNDTTGDRVKAEPEQRIKKKNSSPWTNNEPAPYVTRNPDGSINVGSNAVAAVTNTYMFVYNYVHNENNDLKASDSQIIAISQKVLSTINKAQVLIKDGEITKPDMSAGSHTRARSLVFHTIETVNKLNQEHIDDKEALNSWTQEILERVVKMWKWSVSIADKIEE